MSKPNLVPLPLHRALEELDVWRERPTPGRRRAVRAALTGLFQTYGVNGAYLVVHAPDLPDLRIGFGTLKHGPRQGGGRVSEHRLSTGNGNLELGRLWLDAEEQFVQLAARAIELAVDAAWSRSEAREAQRRLAALDAAVRGIAGVLSVERVLQLIVDRVRALVAARYAALGIVGPFGVIDQFITSGITREQRERIGALPRGRGLLGLIIREDRSFRIDDMAADPRSFGFPPHHPEMHSFLGVPVRSKGQSIGNLYLTNKETAPGFSEADERLVEMFALHAGIAIHNARLHEEVSRLAVIEERHRISQDLHDSIIQSLYGVTLSLEDLPELITEAPSEGTARLDHAIDSVHQTIRDIRNFISGMRPEMLDQSDLASGIHSLAAEFRLNTMVDLEVYVEEPPDKLAAEAATHLLAMTREGLSNIARHAAATRASLELRHKDGTLQLIIGDNGRGFDVDVERTKTQHGLANLRSRAEAMGGSLIVHSEPAAGTRLKANIPIQSERGRDTTEAADAG